MESWRERTLRWIFIAIVLGAIESVVRLDLVDRTFLTSPSLIAAKAWEELLSGDLAGLLGITAYEVAVAFGAATIAGLPMGYTLWRYPLLGRAYDDLLGAAFASPLILLYPISLVIFGRGTTAIIVMGFLYGVIPIVLNTHQGLREVSLTYVKVGRSMRLSDGQIIRHILFPAASATIIGGLKLGLTYILISVIALEFLVDIGGIGTLASKGYFWFNTEELYLGVVSAIILSMIFIYFLEKPEARRLG